MTSSRIATSNGTVAPVEPLLPVVVAFEKWWIGQRDILELSPAMKFAAWNGWLAHSKSVPSETRLLALCGKGGYCDFEPPCASECRRETLPSATRPIGPATAAHDRTVWDAARYRAIREHGIPCTQADECGSCTGDELDKLVDDAIAHPEKYDV